MKQLFIGVNVPRSIPITGLSEYFDSVMDNGFTCVEFGLANFPIISNGLIKEEFIDYLKPIFNKSSLKFAAHIGMGLDLRNMEEYELHKQVLISSIDICEKLGLSPLTLHFEESSKFTFVEDNFFKAHEEAAGYAEKKGVLLCIENIEIEIHTRVLDMIKNLNHRNFRMTLDTGHLYLSTNYFGYNYKKAVEECVPYVSHLHLSDNVGRFQKLRIDNFALYRTLPMPYRIAFGYGDVHLPPFWGEIPLETTLKPLIDIGYNGQFLCEYNSSLYEPFNKKIQDKVRMTIENLYLEK